MLYSRQLATHKNFTAVLQSYFLYKVGCNVREVVVSDNVGMRL